MLWEELVIRFEWIFAIQELQEDSNLGEEVKAVVKEAEKGIRFEFTEQMVRDWSASINPSEHEDGLFESFMQYVSSREQRSALSQSQ